MEYNYDVALSFAEEDRNIALAIALALELQGVKKVYYYPLHYEVTWGAQLEEKLRSIYFQEARYAIVLLSDQYFQKKWAAVEYAAIRERTEGEPGTVYRLPVLLQELAKDVVEEYSGTGYFRWQYNPKEIAGSIVRLLGKPIKDVAAIQEEINRTVILLSGLKIDADHVVIGQKGASSGKDANQHLTMKNSEIKTKTFILGTDNTK